jgi:hypothetical protein
MPQTNRKSLEVFYDPTFRRVARRIAADPKLAAVAVKSPRRVFLAHGVAVPAGLKADLRGLGPKGGPQFLKKLPISHLCFTTIRDGVQTEHTQTDQRIAVLLRLLSTTISGRPGYLWGDGGGRCLPPDRTKGEARPWQRPMATTASRIRSINSIPSW